MSTGSVYLLAQKKESVFRCWSDVVFVPLVEFIPDLVLSTFVTLEPLF